MAFNFFKMAVSRRMTRGRKTSHVIAACLYLVCRCEKSPHMLLDFSDALQVNVYSLGRTYLHLSKELCMNLPDVDPCLYIPRFAHALDFEEKTHEVSMTAMRLVQRMKRDWMSTGRRPSGLCGAALLVAARIHDFSRSVKEVIKVVKVCQSTLRKRLTEFEDTPSSKLTIEEFQTIDLEEEQDPPSFTEGKKKAKKLQEQSRLPDYATEVSKLQEEIEETLKKQKPRGIWAAYAKMADDDCSQDSSRSTDQVTDSQVSMESGYASMLNTSSLDNQTMLNTSVASESEKSETTDTLKPSAIVDTIIPGQGEGNTGAGKFDAVLKSQRVPSLGVDDAIQECLGEGSENSKDGYENCEELDLTGLDDAELDRFILSEHEVIVKTKIWMAENADYLEEQRLKEEKKRKEAEEEAKKPPEKRKKKITRKRKPPIQEGASAQEVIQKIIQEKKISCKINYDVLNDLNVKSAAAKTAPERTGLQWPTSSLDNKPSIARLRKASVSVDLTPEVPVKKTKVESVPMLPLTAESPAKPEIVVETGPVQYDHKDEGYLEEEEDADDYYDEDEHHVSAAQLLGNTGVEDDYYDEIMD